MSENHMDKCMQELFNEMIEQREAEYREIFGEDEVKEIVLEDNSVNPALANAERRGFNEAASELAETLEQIVNDIDDRYPNQ